MDIIEAQKILRDVVVFLAGFEDYIELVKRYKKPEDVFDYDTLYKWALENGFIRDTQ